MSLPVQVRAMLVPGAAGVLAGQVAVAGLLASDVAGLRGLILHSDAPFVPVLLLCFGFAVTFGSVAIGASIIALGEDD